MARVAQPKPGEGITLTYDGTGRARYKVRIRTAGGRQNSTLINRTFDTLKQAREFREETRADRARGTLARGSKMTFEAYATQWLDSRTARKVTVAGSYTGQIRKACRAFGGKRLTEVTRADVNAVVTADADKGLSKRTTAMFLMVVRGVLDDAVDEGLIVRNPARKVKPAGTPARNRSALPPADVAKVAKVLKEGTETGPLWGCWQLTLLGLRRSEVLGLRWSDVVLTGPAPSVSVKRGRVRVATGGVRTAEGPTKTRQGERVLPIGDMPDLLAALREMRQRQLADHGAEQVRTGYLAVRTDGTEYPPDRWSLLWKRACESAAVSATVLHGARHSSVTTMRDHGVADHVVARWHGHDELIMRVTYSHAHEEGLRSAGAALAAAWADEA